MADANGLRIGTFAGAAVVIDSTFLLLGAYVLGSAVLSGGLDAIGGALIFLAVLALAVVLHEFGHAGAAALFKIPSKRIVLTFFGGYVQFAWPPTKRWHEIVVSAAGPAVNLISWIAAAFALNALAPTFDPNSDASRTVLLALSQFAYASLILGAFNLLPGFPLDGGHILRAALSYAMSRERAGIVAALFGIVVALALIAFALWQRMYWTAGVALLLALSAWAELQRNRALLARGSEDTGSATSNA
jgi:Zn-dependent protease